MCDMCETDIDRVVNHTCHECGRDVPTEFLPNGKLDAPLICKECAWEANRSE